MIGHADKELEEARAASDAFKASGCSHVFWFVGTRSPLLNRADLNTRSVKLSDKQGAARTISENVQAYAARLGENNALVAALRADGHDFEIQVNDDADLAVRVKDGPNEFRIELDADGARVIGPGSFLDLQDDEAVRAAADMQETFVALVRRMLRDGRGVYWDG